MSHLDGLAAHWRFNEGSGSTIADEQGSNDATIQTGTTWDTDPERDTVLSFAGAGEVVVTNAPELNYTSSYSFFVDVKLDSTSGYHAPMAKGRSASSTDNEQYSFIGRDYGAWQLYARDSGGTSHNITSGDFSLGTWYRLGAVYDDSAGELSLYMNGALWDTITGLASPHTTTHDLSFGYDAYRNGMYITGALNEAGIWNRALSQSEMEDVTAQGIHRSTPYYMNVVQNSSLVRFDPQLGDGTPLLVDIVDYNHFIDMEGSTVTSHYTGITDNQTFELDTARVYADSQSLHGWIDANNSWGGNVQFDLGTEGYNDNHNELHQRVEFNIDSALTMNTDDNCRMWNSALADGSGNSGGGQPDGTNGWSNRIYFTERYNNTPPDAGNYNLLTYTYHMDKDTTYPTNYPLDTNIPTDTWHTLDTYVKCNTYSGGTANYDGIVKIWCNGTLYYDRSDFRFTTQDDNRIQWCGPVLHYGGTYDAPEQVNVWYDNHEMWIDSGQQL